MASKTVSKTTLNFGMVSVNCRLQKAADKKTVGFEMVSPAGNPVKQRYVDVETGELMLPAETQKAAVAADGSLVLVSKDTLKAIDETCKLPDLSIEGFMDLDDVPFERAEACYFVAPAQDATPGQAKPLALLAAALAQTGKAGHGKLTLRTTQRAFVVYAKDGGLVVNTLVFADEFIDPAVAAAPLAAIALDAKTVALAATLIEAQASEPGALDNYTDEARPLKAELIDKVLAGETVAMPEAKPEPETSEDLDALLIASIGTSPLPAKPKKQKVAA